jgi:tetratricopeptide (TPR) repeat protein
MDITSCLAGIQRWFDNLWHSLQLPASFYAWTFVLLLLIPLQDMKARSAQAEYEHAWNLFLHGDLAKSQQEAEQGAWRFQIADPAYALKFQLLEAQSMLFRGMYEDALRVLAVLHPTSGNPNWTIQKLALEAIALSRQQQFAPASQRLKEAEALCKESAPESCGEVLRARGILAGMQGQRATARRYYLNTLVFARAHHDRWSEAGTLINLGFSALQLERYDEALDWLRAAYQIAVELGADNQLQFVAGNLGWTYYSLGDGEKALELFLEAEKSAARLGNVHMELNWVGAKGSVYRDTGDLTHAAESYRRTLDLAKQIDSKEDIVNALENLAQVLVETGKLEEASGYLNQVTFMERSYSNRLSGQVMLTQGMLATARHQDQQAETLFSAVRNDATSPTTTRLGAGNELARLFEQQGNTREAERVYKATLTAFESARAQLKNEDSRLPFAANATRIYDGYIHLLVKQGRSEEALAAADQSRAQTLAQGLGVAKTSFRPAALNPRQIAQKTGATLLFYWLGDKQSYLWAVTPAKITLIQLPAQKEIVARVERYRWALLDVEDPLQARNEDGQALYQLLVAPAAKLLRRNAPVMILSDGALSQLSFETLLAPGPSPQSDQNSSSGPAMHYLLDDATLLSAPPSLAQPGLSEPAPLRLRDKPDSKALCRSPYGHLRGVSSHSRSLSLQQSGPVFLYPFCLSCSCQPHGPAGFSDHTFGFHALWFGAFRRQGKRDFLQALCPRHHAAPHRCTAGHHLGLLRQRHTLVCRRRIGGSLLGLSTRRCAERHRLTLGGQRRLDPAPDEHPLSGPGSRPGTGARAPQRQTHLAPFAKQISQAILLGTLPDLHQAVNSNRQSGKGSGMMECRRRKRAAPCACFPMLGIFRKQLAQFQK